MSRGTIWPERQDVPPRRNQHILVFEMAGRLCGLPIGHVREVLPLATLVQLPEAPAVLAGVLRLRGSALPVVNLRVRLGLSDVPRRPSQRIVVTLNGSATIGLLVDAVHDLALVDTGPRAADSQRPDQLIQGLVEVPGQLVSVLNLTAVVDAGEAAFLASLLAAPGETRTSSIHDGSSRAEGL